jgi:hypothetical protein
MLLFPSGPPSRIFCGTLLISILKIWPSHSILLDLILVQCLVYYTDFPVPC